MVVAQLRSFSSVAGAMSISAIYARAAAFPRLRQAQSALVLVRCTLGGMRCIGGSSKPPQHSIEVMDPLQQADKKVYGLVQKERRDQTRLLNLIPSANYAWQSVLDASGTVLQNPNSEGYVGRKYFPGTQHLDAIEKLCRRRALEAFDLDNAVWGVNVQTHSRELSCLQACSALLGRRGRLVARGLRRGSHISKHLPTATFDLDYPSLDRFYEALGDFMSNYRPQVLLVSSSASSKLLDYQVIGEICRPLDTSLVVDMTATSGLIATGIVSSPFPHGDVVITGTQGPLRGPGGALIFFRRGLMVEDIGHEGTTELRHCGDAIDRSVFPGHQGGPHNHSIAAVAVAMRRARSKSFEEYQRHVLANSKALRDRLVHHGYILNDEGPQTHHLVVKLGAIDVTVGHQLLDAIGVASLVLVAKKELHIGTLAMTSRGLALHDFCWVADIIHRALTQARKLGSNSKSLADDGNEERKLSSSATFDVHCSYGPRGSTVAELRREVETRVGGVPVPHE